METKIVDMNEKREVYFSGKMGYQDHSVTRKLILDMSKDDMSEYVIDLSDLNYIDSAGLGMLILIGEEAKNTGIKISIRNAHGQVEKLFKVSDFQSLVYFDS